MEQKALPLINQGMNRDLSISKAGESNAYENHNIRILNTDHDTSISVTNERGNKEIQLGSDIEGTLIGWNVLNEHIILFTTTTPDDKTAAENDADKIYRVDYKDDRTFELDHLFSGNLGFDIEHPIESVVYYETEKIQKIYWVDGKNVLRFMNFMADADERSAWSDGTYFDSNRAVEFGVTVEISKDNSGNPRANGVVQYLLTYFNKHGQESGYVWISDLVYLSPMNSGGSADSLNNNKVTLKFSGLDTRFSNFRIYSVFRSAYDGVTTGYIVGEDSTSGGTATIVDDGAHLTAIDSSSLLYLGSKNFVPGTLAHKDQTLFLGDLQSVGRGSYDEIESAIRSTMIGNGGISSAIRFVRVDGIDYPEDTGTYSYENQLKYTSSQITTFKGGEKYRFAICLIDKNGVSTDAFWVGDAVNPLYPKIEDGKIKKINVVCTLSSAVLRAIRNAKNREEYPIEFVEAQLMMAEASYADRSIKAQGIINPTMFNVWNRYNDRLYSVPSWISRPRNSGFVWKHFESVHSSSSSTGEIVCNYWDDSYSGPDESYIGDTKDKGPLPYYNITDDHGDVKFFQEKYNNPYDWDYVMMVYGIECYEKNKLDHGYVGFITVITAKLLQDSTAALEALQQFKFTNDVFYINAYGYNQDITYDDPDGRFQIRYRLHGASTTGTKKKRLYTDLTNFAINECSVPGAYIVDSEAFEHNWCLTAHENWDTYCYFNQEYEDTHTSTYGEMLNYSSDNTEVPTGDRWIAANPDVLGSMISPYTPSYMNMNYMFVDENVLTLNSPEIEYESVSFDNADNLKIRIVGVAKITCGYNDYIVDATHGKLPGANLVKNQLSHSIDGITAWPLWREYGLAQKVEDDNGDPWKFPEDREDYSSKDFMWGTSVVRYWLHMFSKSGKINNFTDSDNSVYSTLNSKTFANLRFSSITSYNDETTGYSLEYDLTSLRLFNYTSSQTVALGIGSKENNDTKFYDGIVSEALTMPLHKKYKILHSTDSTLQGDEVESESCYIFSDTPVMLEYSSSPHAVFSLESKFEGDKYVQRILPRVFDSEEVSFATHWTTQAGVVISGALVPWVESAPNIYDFASGAYEEAEIEFHVTAEYNSSTKKISLLLTDDIEAVQILSAGWSNAMSVFSSDNVYASVLADDGYRYFVRINDHEYTGSSIVLNDADVVVRTSEAGTSLYVDMFYLSDDYSTQVWKPVRKLVDVWTVVTTDIDTYPYKDYKVKQDQINLQDNVLIDGDRYLFIGEIFDPDMDNLYGGTTEAALELNKFIAAGPRSLINNDWNGELIGNEGDTFFQRWDCLKTKPYSNSSVNNVIDITSFMVETHINIDGRTDLQRGVNYLASIDYAQFGTLNRVYSQPDNFIASMDLDEDFNLDEYRSSVTWTLQKSDSADVDEWTHITLASSLKLDGDKGICRAIRRIANSLIAFQDRGVSEILFNSRTQLSTTDGVPVEIANSGKVDGKRYISNRFGCINKWSIIEGKQSLYFIDNINKAFCAFSGDGIQDLSTGLGFKTWFNRKNSTEVWNPTFNNIVSFFDKTHSDIYLVSKDENDDMSCLVYSELLQRFSSFFDYSGVPMMTNVKDRFVSFKKHSLWLQNEGLYCNFFGDQYDFWVNYRVTPNPYTDKIWAGVDYRADFFRVLDENGTMEVAEQSLINGDLYDDNEGIYQEDTTFDKFKAWNEYQQTDENDITRHITSRYPDIRKKFRIWRLNMPRAMKSDTNRYGLDRIRNPWLQFRFKKILTGANEEQNKDLMQLHDVTVRYFE